MSTSSISISDSKPTQELTFRQNHLNLSACDELFFKFGTHGKTSSASWSSIWKNRLRYPSGTISLLNRCGRVGNGRISSERKKLLSTDRLVVSPVFPVWNSEQRYRNRRPVQERAPKIHLERLLLNYLWLRLKPQLQRLRRRLQIQIAIISVKVNISYQMLYFTNLYF